MGTQRDRRLYQHPPRTRVCLGVAVLHQEKVRKKDRKLRTKLTVVHKGRERDGENPLAFGPPT